MGCHEDRGKGVRRRVGVTGFMLHTPEASWDINQAYAFFAYAWTTSEARGPHPEGSRIPRTPCGVRMLIAYFLQGTQKSAYPWLSSWHRSAVRSFEILRTPEVCWDISQVYAFFAYAWLIPKPGTAP